jgi:large subunit ribosomal protein L32
MGAVPKKKISKSRRGMRRSQTHISIPPLSDCPNCRAPKPTHRVCPTCGTYNGHQILKVEPAKKAQ